MKRLVSLICVMTMLLGMLTGCAGTSGAQQNLAAEPEQMKVEPVEFDFDDIPIEADVVTPVSGDDESTELAPKGDRIGLFGGYTPSLSGEWEEVTINGDTLHAKAYDTVYDCTKLTVKINVEMKNGASCYEWDVYARNGSFKKIGSIYLSGGNGRGEQTFTFKTPLTFDAIAVQPTARGSYSYAIGIGVYDVYTKSGSNFGSGSGSNGSGSSGGSGSQDGYIPELEYELEKVTIVNGRSKTNAYARVFDRTIYNCTQLTINMEVTMNAGTNCKDWQLWGRSGNTFVKIGTINLPYGDGYTSATLRFRDPVTFDALAITPTVPGSYSYSMSFSVTDVYYKTSSGSGNNGGGSSGGSGGSGSALSGYWESATIRDGNSTYNISALVFGKYVYNCKQLTINMNVTMHNGTNCKSWQLWGRSGNTFVKIGSVSLPYGDGSTVQTIRFSNPVSFDALALTPKIPGGYSWSMDFSVSDVITR